MKVIIVVSLLCIFLGGCGNWFTTKTVEGVIKDTWMRPGGMFAIFIEGIDEAFITDIETAKKYELVVMIGDEAEFIMVTTGSGRRVRIRYKKDSNQIESLSFLSK
jgi:hypothetical protein